MTDVIILNGDYTFLGFTSWKRAIILLENKKVEIIKQSNKFIKTMGGRLINIPIVIRLMKFIRNLYRKEVPFSKKNILTRDGYICQFCGTKLTKNATYKDKDFKKTKATVDHIIPQSKGGYSTWENCVCSCYKCNNEKGNLTMTEAKLTLIKRPFKPTISEFIQIRAKIHGLENILADMWS